MSAARPLITVQSILFHSDPQQVFRALESIDNAARWALVDGRVAGVEVRYGDCSPSPVVTSAMLEDWKMAFPNLSGIDMVFFGENLGHGGGQNSIAALSQADLLFVVDPDVIVSYNCISILAHRFEDGTIGAAEAKQLPLEHPKDYDVRTGATSWVTSAACMMRMSLFRALNGFDHDSFFMYGDDVDLSWRMRLGGSVVVTEPSAVAFHDKRLDDVTGVFEPKRREDYYSVESALLLADKWSRPDVVEDILAFFQANPSPVPDRACDEYRRRRDTGQLSGRLDPDHQTAEFNLGNYAHHRYEL